jgi:transcriptional regulator
MYLPRLFHNTDRAQLLELMRDHPFATVVAVNGEEPEVAHLPVLVLEGEPLRLQAHVARGNPLAQMVEAGARLTVIFHGPHCYVSPRLYANAENVPTWNYAVVHAQGRARALSQEATLPHLRALIASFEAGAPQPWAPEQAGALPDRLLPGVVAFEVEVDHLEGKFKLNQNRKPEDWQGVVAAFERSERPDERAVLTLMKRNGPPR